jgi:arylsulfatase A-like enzyme
MKRFVTNFSRLFLFTLFSIFSLVAPSDVSLEPVEAQRQSTRPNIIVIMSDDMGYSDLGCYGGEINTPNLDALAKNGLRFTQFYNTARCCPTRAALLTGLYPHQAGIGHMTEDRGHDGYRGDLNEQCVTMAEALRPAGYATYAVGKWHVTKKVNPKSEADKHNWPMQRGFDRFYGTIAGGGSYWDPSALVRNNELTTIYSDPEYQPKEQFYYTDALSDNAIKFIRENQTNKPFFMYLTYTAAHWPMHARERDIAKYKGRYDQGYEPIRKARYERMKQMGLVDARWSLSPQAGDWDKVKDKQWEARGMEVYAAMIDSMDQGIGRIVAELKQRGQFENTVILYMQDNGACAELTGRNLPGPNAIRPYSMRPGKAVYPTIAKDAQYYFNSQPVQTRDGRAVIMGPNVLPGPDDTFIAYGQAWANVSNTPFREYKHWNHEGGISTPLIVHWPKGIPGKQRNQFVTMPSHLIDIMATVIDLSGAKYPTMHNGKNVLPMEGVSLRPLFTGKSVQRSQPIFWEHEGNRAIRVGSWKLVAKENQSWELYDIAADRSEMHDLAAKHPDKVKDLAAQWDAWAARANVLPLGAWRAQGR